MTVADWRPLHTFAWLVGWREKVKQKGERKWDPQESCKTVWSRESGKETTMKETHSHTHHRSPPTSSLHASLSTRAPNHPRTCPFYPQYATVFVWYSNENLWLMEFLFFLAMEWNYVVVIIKIKELIFEQAILNNFCDNSSYFYCIFILFFSLSLLVVKISFLLK